MRIVNSTGLISDSLIMILFVHRNLPAKSFSFFFFF